MVRVWVAGKLCDPVVTHGPYLSSLEIKGYNKALYKLLNLSVYLLTYLLTMDCVLLSVAARYISIQSVMLLIQPHDFLPSS